MRARTDGRARHQQPAGEVPRGSLSVRERALPRNGMSRYKASTEILRLLAQLRAAGDWPESATIGGRAMSRGIEQRPRSFPRLANARLRENRGRFRGEGAFKVGVDPNVVGRRPQLFPTPSLVFLNSRRRRLRRAAGCKPFVVHQRLWLYPGPIPDCSPSHRGGSIRPPRDGEPDDQGLSDDRLLECSLYPGLSEEFRP